MFRKSLFRTTRLCIGGECAPLLQGQGKHMFIHSSDCTHFREVCFKWLSWLSANCAFQIQPDFSASFNFSHSFYQDFIKYLKIQQTSADSCFQEICTVTTLLDSGKSSRRMATVEAITISVTLMVKRPLPEAQGRDVYTSTKTDYLEHKPDTYCIKTCL